MFKLKETIPGTERANQLSSDMNKTTTIKKLNKINKIKTLRYIRVK